MHTAASQQNYQEREREKYELGSLFRRVKIELLEHYRASQTCSDALSDVTFCIVLYLYLGELISPIEDRLGLWAA